MNVLKILSVALVACSFSARARTPEDPVTKIFNWIDAQDSEKKYGYANLVLDGTDSQGVQCDLNLRAVREGQEMRIYAHLHTAELTSQPGEQLIYGGRYVSASITGTNSFIHSLWTSNKVQNEWWGVTNKEFVEGVTKRATNLLASNGHFGFSYIFATKPARYEEISERMKNSLSTDTRIEWDLGAGGKPIEARGFDLGGANPTTPIAICHLNN